MNNGMAGNGLETWAGCAGLYVWYDMDPVLHRSEQFL